MGSAARGRGIRLAQSVLAVPLKVQGQVIGQLRLDHDQPGFIDRATPSWPRRSLTRRPQRLPTRGCSRPNGAVVSIWCWRSRRARWAPGNGNRRPGRVIGSPQLEAIRGLAPGAFPQTFEATFRDIHPDDVERVKQTVSESLERGLHHIEFRVVRPDGQVRWLESRGQVIRDADGRSVGMRGVLMDVTERKDAEEERNRLMASEQAAVEARIALEERQKLARELHDSVSQSLYGLGTAAQTARSALDEDHDPEAASRALGYVVLMADAGLAEMRALISELRPESLAQEGLVAALERHVASVRARHTLQVTTDLGAEPDVPLATKEAPTVSLAKRSTIRSSTPAPPRPVWWFDPWMTPSCSKSR